MAQMQFGEVPQRIVAMESRLDALAVQSADEFGKLNARLDESDQRRARLGGRLDTIDQRIDQVNTQIDQVNGRLDTIKSVIAKILTILERDGDTHEEIRDRIAAVEGE